MKITYSIEKAYQEEGTDSIEFQREMQNLKQQLREYCEKNGIKEVNNLNKNQEVKQKCI